MDWSKCFICQKRKGDLRGTSDGYKQMSQNLLEFRKWGGIEELNFSIIAEGNAPRLITQFTINLVLLLKIQQRTFKETTRRTQGTTEPKY